MTLTEQNDNSFLLTDDLFDKEHDTELEQLQEDLQNYNIDKIVDIPLDFKVSTKHKRQNMISQSSDHAPRSISVLNKTRLMEARNRVLGHHA